MSEARENIDALLFWAIELGATHGRLTGKAIDQLLAAIQRAEKWVKQDNITEDAALAELVAERDALRADLARISRELGLPPGIGPAEGEITRLLGLSVERAQGKPE